jgi:hypothetical protein
MPVVMITPLHNAGAGPVDVIAVTRLTPNHVVTAVREGSGDLKVIIWEIGADGSLTRRGDATVFRSVSCPDRSP